MSTLQAAQLLKQKKRDANVRVAENMKVHSQSRRPVGSDAGGDVQAAALGAWPAHSAASSPLLSFYGASLLSRL